jgi:MoaA/NifB/PqqE/SkfB family radical SAM enzyme
MPLGAGSKGLIREAARCHSVELELARRIWAGTATVEEVLGRLRFHRVEEVSVETNQTCQLHCHYCYLDPRPRTSTLPAGVLNDLARELVEEGVPLIAFVGKESFADASAISLMEALDAQLKHHKPAERRTRFGVITNGIRLPRFRHRLDQLACLDYVDVSLDGPQAANDQLRGPGSFASALGGIRCALELRNATLIVAAVLHKPGSGHLRTFFNQLRDFGVRHFHLSPVQNLTGDPFIDSIALSLDELLGGVVETLQEMAQQDTSGYVTLELFPEHCWPAIARGLLDLDQVRVDSRGTAFLQPDAGLKFFIKLGLLPPDFWRLVRITHDGCYLGSVRHAARPDYAGFSVGSINDQSFSQLWRSSFTKNEWFEAAFAGFCEWVLRQCRSPNGHLHRWAPLVSTCAPTMT